MFAMELWVIVFNATSNNISDLSWRSVLLVKETETSGEIYRPVASPRQTLSHEVAQSTLVLFCFCFCFLQLAPINIIHICYLLYSH